MKFKAICLAAFLLFLIPVGFQASGASMEQTRQQAESLDPVLVARLENMLDHNRVYDSDFSDISTVVDHSILALLDRAEDGFIKADIVDGFVYHMYGMTVAGYTPDERLNQRSGYYAILPRGYSQIDHTITDIKEQNNRLTVTSEVTVRTHDSQTLSAVCETVFAVNPDSAFGYNILSSVIS